MRTATRSARSPSAMRPRSVEAGGAGGRVADQRDGGGQVVGQGGVGGEPEGGIEQRARHVVGGEHVDQPLRQQVRHRDIARLRAAAQVVGRARDDGHAARAGAAGGGKGAGKLRDMDALGHGLIDMASVRSSWLMIVTPAAVALATTWARTSAPRVCGALQ
jgi:hypothetical protein